MPEKGSMETRPCTLRCMARPRTLSRPLLLKGLLVSAALLLACSKSSLLISPGGPAVVADINEDGVRQLRAQHRGRVLLINLWATWCEPCRDEFPALVKLDRTYRERGLSVVGVSMDDDGTDAAIVKFLKSQGAEYPNYHRKFQDLETFANNLDPHWSGGIPSSFLYDRNGNIVKFWMGETKFEDFERQVRPLLP